VEAWSRGVRPPGTYGRELANRTHESLLHEAIAFSAHKHICEAQKSVEALAQLHKATTTELERKIIIFSQKGKKKKLIIAASGRVNRSPRMKGMVLKPPLCFTFFSTASVSSPLRSSAIALLVLLKRRS